MSIDPQTGRYCLPCSIDLRWRLADIAGALDGLPPEAETRGKPITDLLCGWHRLQFLNIPLTKPQTGANGRVLRYPNGEPSLVDAGYFPRAYDSMHYHLAQKDLLALLERMEKWLRLLDAARRRAQLIEVICEEPTVVLPSAPDLLAKARLHAEIYDFLAEERLHIPDANADDDAEIRKFFEQHPIDFDNRFGGEE